MSANQAGNSDRPTEIFQARDLLIDIGQQSVSRADQEIPLPNLSFKLLVALVRAAPNFLSNELLMERVWPGIVVSSETVSKRAALLREALGDNSREPRYIAGLRSRGYRIIVPVSTATRVEAKAQPPGPLLPAAAPAPAMDPQPKRGSKRRKLRAAAAAAAALLICTAILIAELRHRASLGRLESGRTVAVMPFDSVSSNANDAYLATGIPEMLLNRMSSVHGLFVIARGVICDCHQGPGAARHRQAAGFGVPHRRQRAARGRPAQSRG